MMWFKTANEVYMKLEFYSFKIFETKIDPALGDRNV